MLNILFVLYHDFRANSAIHVHNFANHLAGFGNDVIVAIPTGVAFGANLGQQFYFATEFVDVDDSSGRLFADGRPPDVVHAWTPREIVRLFCQRLRRHCSFELFVHLEDNEETIIETFLGQPFADLAAKPPAEVPHWLSHPTLYKEFLSEASGITIIMDRLEEFVPAGKPRLVLWPGADTSLFFPRAKDAVLLAELGIARDALVFCYTGHAHACNATEVRSLYLAAAMLNREGIPTTLVRAGSDSYPFLGPDESWGRAHSVELGYVKHIDIARLLSLADVLIQPGTDSAFNAYRLPSKLPEFFATGKPVILPETNIGRFVQHGVDAWVLPKVDALGIVRSVQEFSGNKALTRQLSEGAVNFCRKHFDWKTNARKLQEFYTTVLGQRLPQRVEPERWVNGRAAESESRIEAVEATQ
jgi:glycosyltransferase involved in cell wall biosynthesis